MTIGREEQSKNFKYYVETKAITELTRKTLVLILAGGEGSRLKDLTKWRAKPAVPFGGKYRIIDFALSNCINSGLRKIGVLTQYRSHSLIRHLQRGWSFLRGEIGEFVELLPAQQRTSERAWYKGTADALYQNLDIMSIHRTDYVIVLGGDHIYTMDYSKMLVQHVESGADLTVGCIEVPRDEAKAYGVMSVGADMRIKVFTEKPDNPDPLPKNPEKSLASMGIYVFSTRFLYHALIEDAKMGDSSHDFGKDIIPNKIKDSIAMAYAFCDEESGEPAYWRDVGSLQSYWRANIELCDIDPGLNLYSRDWPIWTYQTQHPPAKFIFDDEGRRGEAIDSLTAGGVILSGARVKRSVISFATHVERYTTIKDSVILPKVNIGKNCKIKNTIIDKGCVITDDTEIGYNLEEDSKTFHVTEEGIVLVTPDMLGQYLYSFDGKPVW